MLLAVDYITNVDWLRTVILLILLGFLILILQFFRNPKRHTILNNEQVLSPVDGKVVVIEEVFRKNFLKKNAYRSVFLCLL